MEAFHCVETLKTAMDFYGKPEIFNSDQGEPIHQLGVCGGTPGSWHSDQPGRIGMMF